MDATRGSEMTAMLARLGRAWGWIVATASPHCWRTRPPGRLFSSWRTRPSGLILRPVRRLPCVCCRDNEILVRAPTANRPLGAISRARMRRSVARRD